MLKQAFAVSAALALGLHSTVALAQGYAMPQESEAPGSASFHFYQSMGQAMQNQHAIDRAARWKNWAGIDTSLERRVTAMWSDRYDSSRAWTGKDCVTPIKDQSPCNSCWAFAAVALMESAYCIEGHGTVNGSEQSMLDCITHVTDNDTHAKRPVIDVPDRCISGNSLESAFNVLRGIGVKNESEHPWSPGGWTGFTCPVFWQFFNVLRGIDGAVWLPPKETIQVKVDRLRPDRSIFRSVPSFQPHATAIKQAIVDNGAVSLALWLTPSFSNHSKGAAIVSNPAQVVQGEGGHVIIITGWDDSLKAWRIKNSWGTTAGWGSVDGGSGWISYDDVSFQSGSFFSVTPRDKTFLPIAAARTMTEAATLMVPYPNVWIENPVVQWPPSLGFSVHPMTVIDGFREAIARQMIAPSIVAEWPSYARDSLQ